jgi:hypothetical protein
MPISRWAWKDYVAGMGQTAPTQVLVSEFGSLSVEFTRLSMLTGDMKYYDAVQRITNAFEYNQFKTKLPGMWPVVVNADGTDFSVDSGFTLGGMSDSLYEYLPKQYLLLGGTLEQTKTMYEKFLPVAIKNMFFRGLNKQNIPVVVSGDVRSWAEDGSSVSRTNRGQHLTCFAGGMLAIASKAFRRPGEMELAEGVTNGCVWAYDSMPSGIAPEVFDVTPCNVTSNPNCLWDEEAWHASIASLPEGDAREKQAYLDQHRLVPGFTNYPDRRYILRPEAIESVFIMYRTTGDPKWMDTAWRMFEAISKACRTDIAFSAIHDVTVDDSRKSNSMESFWLAETLKYFYLVFSDFDVVDLDTYVLNTEAHPLRRWTPELWEKTKGTMRYY